MGYIVSFLLLAFIVGWAIAYNLTKKVKDPAELNRRLEFRANQILFFKYHGNERKRNMAMWEAIREFDKGMLGKC